MSNETRTVSDLLGIIDGYIDPYTQPGDCRNHTAPTPPDDQFTADLGTDLLKSPSMFDKVSHSVSATYNPNWAAESPMKFDIRHTV